LNNAIAKTVAARLHPYAKLWMPLKLIQIA